MASFMISLLTVLYLFTFGGVAISLDVDDTSLSSPQFDTHC